MTKRAARRAGRATLRGWWKCLPLLALPFSVMGSEIWFQTQILMNDYAASEVRARVSEIDGRIAELRGKGHHLGRLERMHEKAPDLGLVEPNPNQIEVIRTEAPEDGGGGLPYLVAWQGDAAGRGRGESPVALFSAEEHPPLENLSDMD